MINNIFFFYNIHVFFFKKKYLIKFNNLGVNSKNFFLKYKKKNFFFSYINFNIINLYKIKILQNKINVIKIINNLKNIIIYKKNLGNIIFIININFFINFFFFFKLKIKKKIKKKNKKIYLKNKKKNITNRNLYLKIYIKNNNSNLFNHNDLFKDNLIFFGNIITTIIDFYNFSYTNKKNDKNIIKNEYYLNFNFVNFTFNEIIFNLKKKKNKYFLFFYFYRLKKILKKRKSKNPNSYIKKIFYE